MEENKEITKIPLTDEEKKGLENDLKAVDDLKAELEKVYKAGYLDGMIAGMAAAKVDSYNISAFLHCEKKYVDKEVDFYKWSCNNAKKDPYVKSMANKK